MQHLIEFLVVHGGDARNRLPAEETIGGGELGVIVTALSRMRKGPGWLLLGGSVFDHLDVLGGLLVEVLHTGFAAEIDVRAFAGDLDGFAHLSQRFAGHDAFFQRIASRHIVSGRKDAEAEESGGKKEEELGGFHAFLLCRRGWGFGRVAVSLGGPHPPETHRRVRSSLDCRVLARSSLVSVRLGLGAARRITAARHLGGLGFEDSDAGRSVCPRDSASLARRRRHIVNRAAVIHSDPGGALRIGNLLAQFQRQHVRASRGRREAANHGQCGEKQSKFRFHFRVGSVFQSEERLRAFTMENTV